MNFNVDGNYNDNAKNNKQFKKSIIKQNVKVKILKKETNQSDKNNNDNNNKRISNFINNNSNANYNTNNNNLNSGNSKIAEKNNMQNILNKYDSASNSSFKIYESPVKSSKVKDFSERKTKKSNSIFDLGHNSPDIRRKKFELEVPEFKIDFKSNLFFKFILIKLLNFFF